MLIFGLIFISILYGMYAGLNKAFPYQFLANASEGVKALLPNYKPLYWYFIPSEQEQKVTIKHSAAMAPGLTKMVSVQGDHSLAVQVIDADATPVQDWRIEWHEVWPEAPDYLDPDELPKARPGTHIHGAEILANGDLVFNFEHLGMVRMDPCGHVLWRLKYRTHHAIFVAEDGTIWAPAQRNHQQPMASLPFYQPGFVEPVVLQVAPDGSILQEISVFDLLRDNHLPGALYLTSNNNLAPYSSGDTLHLNDVEVFPASKAAGVFAPGDIMISLRNINTILVFSADWKLKYKVANQFVRQHDPDFLDGNTIAIFDNNNTDFAGGTTNPYSQILTKSATTGALDVVYRGTPEHPFFTSIMGKQQWLDNGNLLISESRVGRALELDPTGKPVWELYNIVEPGWLGIMEEVERLPVSMDQAFFAHARQQCGG